MAYQDFFCWKRK